MKIKLSKPQSSKGFTLIEMIGVLAVIAILAALLLPKIFEAINNARVNNAAVSVQTVKTAIADHYAKFGSLAVNGQTGTPVAIADADLPEDEYDSILLGEGFLDKPFAVKIGDGIPANNNIVLAAALDDVAPDGVNTAYDLDDNASTGSAAGNDARGSHVVYAVITGVTLEDARALDRTIDGDSLANEGAATDLRGRVKWAATTIDDGAGYDVYVYLTHR